MRDVLEYLPRRVNTDPFLTAYTLNELNRRIIDQPVVLPVCSLNTPARELAELAPLVLPPLYHEALDKKLQQAIVDRVRDCFPYYLGTRKRAEFRGRFDVIELPQRWCTSSIKNLSILAGGPPAWTSWPRGKWQWSPRSNWRKT